MIGAMLRVMMALVLGMSALPVAAQAPLPRLVERNGVRQLHVDGKPFLVLGGELANSSASSRAYMAKRWQPLADMRLNTVLMPVAWEQIEPVEGRFDFTLLDGLLTDARKANMRIVVLWFGSWKNSMSSYAPAWVKRDERRFPRARTADGTPLEILTPFAEANADADAKAFAALMRHLARTDRQRTVVMVQVENEVAMIPEARDSSPPARAAWAGPVPAALGGGKSWTARFGKDADEAFMAWHFARYVDRVATAGKRELDLPMFVNAALPRPGRLPGSGYPAAGPLPHLFEMWQKGAPAIDFLAPDIYFPNFTEWMRKYAIRGNPLFIPESNQAGDRPTPANALFAIGGLDAIGISPFSIDTIPAEAGRDLGALYAMLHQIAPLILEHQGSDRLWGARPPVPFEGKADLADQSAAFGAHRVTLRFTDPWAGKDAQRPEDHGAIVIQLGPDELLIAGRGVTVTFAPVDGVGKAGIESTFEGEFLDGRWVTGRLLNGDQSHQGRHVRLPPDGYSMQRVRLYRYR